MTIYRAAYLGLAFIGTPLLLWVTGFFNGEQSILVMKSTLIIMGMTYVSYRVFPND